MLYSYEHTVMNTLSNSPAHDGTRVPISITLMDLSTHKYMYKVM